MNVLLERFKVVQGLLNLRLKRVQRNEDFSSPNETYSMVLKMESNDNNRRIKRSENRIVYF